MITELEIKDILANHLDIKLSAFELTDTFDYLGFDDVDLVEFIMVLEDNYTVEIPDDVALAWVTPMDALNYLNRSKM